MLSKINNSSPETNEYVSSFLNLNPDCIKNSFFPIKNLISLMNDIKCNLKNLTSKNLCEIYNKAFILKILDLDYSFVKAIRDALLILKNDLSRTDLSLILKFVCLSQQTKSLKDKEFIIEIAEQLLKLEDKSANNIIDDMWILAKLNYHDSTLLSNNKAMLLNAIPTLNYTRLVKLTQSLATFNLFDHDIINAISDAYNTIIGSTDIKTKVNFSYYLSMILTNNKNSVGDNLKLKITTAVNGIINRDIYTKADRISEVSILNMHLAKIIELPESRVEQYTNNIKKSKDVITSAMQTEVFNFLEKTYDPDYIEITLENFDPVTGYFKDILLRDKISNKIIYIEFDGPDHFFINKTELPNGQTLFRNSIHESLHGHPIITVDYLSFIDGRWIGKTLGQINSMILQFRNEAENLKSESKSVTTLDNIETKPDNRKLTHKENSKKSKKNKKQDQKKQEEAYLDDIIQSYKIESRPVESNQLNINSYKDLLRKHNVKTDTALLKKLFEDNLNDAKRLLDYIQNTKPNFFKENGNLLTEHLINNIQLNNNNEIRNIDLLEACDLLVNYLDEFNQSHIKGLMLSMKYGKLNLLKRLLNLIPETKTKKEFILAFFIASCAFGNITTLNFLLTAYNIDVNESSDSSIVSALLNLLKRPNEVIQAINEQNTPKLHSALMNGNSLPKLTSTPNTTGRNMEGPMQALTSAVYNKQTAIVEFLFANGAVQNYTPDQDGIDRDLLMVSLIKNAPDIAILIIKNSIINPNLHDYYGFSYLHIAASKIGKSNPLSEQYMEILYLLVDLGADPNKEMVINEDISLQHLSDGSLRGSMFLNATTLSFLLAGKKKDMFVKFANKHTNFIKTISYKNEDKVKYTSLLDQVLGYCNDVGLNIGDDLFRELGAKLETQLRNQSKISLYMRNFLPEFKEDNKIWIRRHIFLLNEFKSITWDGTVEETLKKFESAMKAIPWLLDEEIVAFLSKNIDNLIKESNFVKSKEEALNKISKCVYKEQIEAVLLYGFNPDKLNLHNISHPEKHERVRALNLIRDFITVPKDDLSNKCWFINNTLEQHPILSINNIAAPNNLTILNSHYIPTPEIRTWDSIINYPIDDLDLTVNPWVHRIIASTNNNLDYMSLPNMDFKAL